MCIGESFTTINKMSCRVLLTFMQGCLEPISQPLGTIGFNLAIPSISWCPPRSLSFHFLLQAFSVIFLYTILGMLSWAGHVARMQQFNIFLRVLPLFLHPPIFPWPFSDVCYMFNDNIVHVLEIFFPHL